MVFPTCELSHSSRKGSLTLHRSPMRARACMARRSPALWFDSLCDARAWELAGILHVSAGQCRLRRLKGGVPVCGGAQPLPRRSASALWDADQACICTRLCAPSASHDRRRCWLCWSIEYISNKNHQVQVGGIMTVLTMPLKHLEC